jgi:hypothetical protein
MPTDRGPESDGEPPADRREPVGAPVVRGDPEITGAHAEGAAKFDPDDPESLAEAAAVVRDFAEAGTDVDHLYMLRGAAACAALVRGEGSYKAAADRAGVSVGVLRKWARVHDLPISIRRYIALGEIVPSSAKHIARVDGDARYLLAWAVLDHDLTVQEVRPIASAVNGGSSVEEALAEHDALPGRKDVSLPIDLYHDLRLEAAAELRDLDELIAEAVGQWLDDESSD